MKQLAFLKKGPAAVLCAAVLWSFAGLLIRGTGGSAAWFLLVRNGAAALALLPAAWRFRKQIPWRATAIAALCYTGFMVSFAVSTRVAGAAATVAGQYTAPLFVYLLLWHQKKLTPSWKNATPVLFIAAGCAVNLVQGFASPTSLLLPISCGVLFPMYSAALRRCEGISMAAVMCVCNAVCSLCALPLAMLTAPPSGVDVAVIAVAGVVVSGFGYVLYAKGAVQTAPFACMMLCLAEPILNPIWVFLLLGESPGMRTIVSLGLILCGGITDMLRVRRIA